MYVEAIFCAAFHLCFVWFRFDEVVEGRETKLSSAADGALDEGRAEGAADGEESSCNLISVSDDLDEHQAELLEGALAARQNNETESSCSDESETEDEEESCGSAKPQESSEEEAQEEEEQSASDVQDESLKRECKLDDDSQEASSASDSGESQRAPL